MLSLLVAGSARRVGVELIVAGREVASARATGLISCTQKSGMYRRTREIRAISRVRHGCSRLRAHGSGAVLAVDERRIHLADVASIVCMAVVIVVMVCTRADYGLTYDEEPHIVLGERVLQFYTGSAWSLDSFRRTSYGAGFDCLPLCCAESRRGTSSRRTTWRASSWRSSGCGECGSSGDCSGGSGLGRSEDCWPWALRS